MNTQTCENEYPDIAIITVARYAGIDVLDVLTTLGLDPREKRSSPSVNVTSFAIRHSRALYTVAKFSGLDVALVAQRLEHPEQTRHEVDTMHTDMAA
jgi:hypothetical protein